MTEALKSPSTQQDYQESRIEEEPILGQVLAMPDGRVHPLSWLDRVKLRLHLTDARALESRYFAA
jgi:hypothetical protein